MERGCTGCLDYHTCPDAFTDVSKLCNAYDWEQSVVLSAKQEADNAGDD